MTATLFRTKDHPEANGRTPQRGESGYTMIFPLENGSSLHVAMGKEGIEKFREFLGSMDLDDLSDPNAVAKQPNGAA